MKERTEEYGDLIRRLYPELFYNTDYENKTGDTPHVISVTFQVTDRCNLACSYCYQINKGTRRMSFETAKKLIDLLLSGDKNFNEYVNPESSPAIILDFIGGEPLLEIELIEKIVEYFQQQTILLKHPWGEKYIVSICSNGVLYQNENVQRILEKLKQRLSFSVTLDGNQELHDKCRVFPDGSPSYHLARAACDDWMDKGNPMGSKITVAPANVEYVYEASKHMFDIGYNQININCVYEDGWTNEHAKTLYLQLKKFADYLLSLDNIDDYYYAFFNDKRYKPMPEVDNKNYCGGTGQMLAMDPDGYLYPCLRYMESSVGTECVPMRLGHVDTGIAATKEEQQRIKCLKCITRRSQSTDECFNCPIATGCGWCSAFNYQTFGTVDKRATFRCCMHKAEALANVYFWNKYYQRIGSTEKFEMHCPKEWAVPIIGEEEYNYLLQLSQE